MNIPDHVPAWARDGSYFANNPRKFELAISRWLWPVTTPAERTAAQLHIAEPAYACAKCGTYSFEKPKLCYWCRRRIAT